jgi:UDP-N-acetyl-D-galactosamine dehydrogenase
VKELDIKIAVIGQGYVGLPLAVEFAKVYPVIGFDIKESRITELSKGVDSTKEVPSEQLLELMQANSRNGLQFASKLEAIKDCTIYIVTVPTPIDQFKAPDLGPLRKSSEMLVEVLKKGDYVIYESTTYPGCTEEVCVPILESTGLKFNEDFFVGYSPERINPGDKVHSVRTIKKVTSGSTPEAGRFIDSLYQKVVDAGTHLAPSIKVAEASKAIENAQRDVNISFVNELAVIFDRIGIDTYEVLEAASTKWNFLPFKPGLVGGHCISVDPYYLSHKAESLGYHPAVILSGRRVNDNMGMFVANKVLKLMMQKDLKIKGSKVLLLGFTFKENCPDIRNTRVIDIYRELEQFGLEVEVYDPWANKEEVQVEYGIPLKDSKPSLNDYSAVILTVSHKEFLDFDYNNLKDRELVVFDTKNFLDRQFVDARL